MSSKSTDTKNTKTSRPSGAGGIAEVVMNRRRLPGRRGCESFSFEINGLRFTTSIGRFDDGRIAEVFLNNHKAGNQSDTNARDAAILLSFALQHGADINQIRKSLCRDGAGRALGPIGAVLDLIADMQQ